MRSFTIPSMLFLVFTLSSYSALAADSGTAATSTTQPAAKVIKEVVEPENVVEGVTGVIKLFKAKEWRPAIAALITLLVFIWRRFLGKIIIDKIPSKHLAWVTAAIGLLATLPVHLSASPFSVWHFILDGFITGAEAAILWSMLGKHLLPKIFGEVKKSEVENG